MNIKNKLALFATFTLFLVVPEQSMGQLLVGNLQGGNNVLRFDQNTGAFLNVCASGGTLSDPEGMTFGVDGNLYVSSYNSSEVLRFNGTTCAFIDAFVTAGSGGLSGPEGLAFGPDGNLYVASWNTNQVLRYNGITGAFVDAFASGDLQTPYGLTFGPDGNLYVAGTSAGSVFKFDGVSGASLGVFAAQGSGGLDQPSDLTFGPDGNLYVTSNSGGPAEAPSSVLGFNGVTGAFLTALVPPGRINGARGLTFGPDGSLYVSSYYSNEVLRFNGASGSFISVFVAGGSGGLSGPRFLRFAPSPYNVCLLYDATHAVHSGATLPIKIQLCDAAGANLSANTTIVHAVSTTKVSTNITGPVADAGNANPDLDFRFDPSLGGTGGYIFNLKTTGFGTGTYTINFIAGTTSTLLHAPFQVK